MSCYLILDFVLTIISFNVCLVALIWKYIKEEKNENTNKKHIFFEFEIRAIILELIYYLFYLLISFINLLNRSNNNKTQQFFKNKLFKLLWPFVMNSAIVFYLGASFRWFQFDIDKIKDDSFFPLFIHGAPQLCFLIDLIFFKHRNNNPKYFLDFLIITSIYSAYCILLFSEKPDISTYLFLDKKVTDKKDDYYILSLMGVCYFVYLYMHFFYRYIVKFKTQFRQICGGYRYTIEKEIEKADSKLIIDDDEDY